MNKTDYTLVECLQKAEIAKLPEKAKEGDLWSRAILRVLKGDGNEYYVVQGTDANGNLCIKNDFEDTYAIVRVLDTYPISIFDPIVLNKNVYEATREEKTRYLMFNDSAMTENWVPEVPVLNRLSDAELTALCIRLLRFRDNARTVCRQQIAATAEAAKAQDVKIEAAKAAKKASKPTSTKTTKTKSNDKSKAKKKK